MDPGQLLTEQANQRCSRWLTPQDQSLPSDEPEEQQELGPIKTWSTTIQEQQ